MAKNELVVKSNQVIEASYRLSIIEQRVILAAITQIPNNQEVSDDVVYFVSIAQLQQLGVHEKRAYQDLEEGISRLYKRSITMSINNKIEEFRWIQKIERIESKGVIGLRFSKDILPFISNLSREFTKYALSDIAGMSSAYAIRIYELLIQYKSTTIREIYIDDLRNMLELTNKYPLYADLKRWVIDTSVRQINEYTPITTQYIEYKTGRKVTRLVFNFSYKEAINKKISIKLLSSRDENIPDLFNSMTDKQRNFFAHKLVNLESFKIYANVGELTEDFQSRIEDMLNDVKNIHRWEKYLKNVGFIFNR